MKKIALTAAPIALAFGLAACDSTPETADPAATDTTTEMAAPVDTCLLYTSPSPRD